MGTNIVAPSDKIETNLSDSSCEQSVIEYDQRILISLRRIMRSIDQYSNRLRSEFNITGPQLICLLNIVNENPETISRISKAVSLSASTVVGIIDRLEKKELVFRERSNSDRRQVKVLATAKGYEIAAKAPSPLQDTLSKNLKSHSELTKNSMALALETLVEMMEVEQFDAAPILEMGDINQPNDR